jgi:hypothetical protein
MMLNLNMVVLTEKVIVNFRKLIFAWLCIFKHLVAGGEPKIQPPAPSWYRGAINLKLPPLPLVTSLDTRPTEKALPSVQSNMEYDDMKERAIEARRYCAVYANEMKEKKRQEREAEKKKEEDELAAIKAGKKKEADEKLAQQAQRVAADKKVHEMLKKKGFSTQVIARGAAAGKRQQNLLVDKAFAVPPEDKAQLLADQEERATSKK